MITPLRVFAAGTLTWQVWPPNLLGLVQHSPMRMPVRIRRESAGESDVIRTITAAAFARAGRQSSDNVSEARLVDDLRASRAWLPALSMVAIDPGGEVIGHVLCTRGHVDHFPALGLGPLTVRPDCQRRGVGSALMYAVLGAADALGEPLVALLGSPGYYDRFGFSLSTDYGIAPPKPEWQPYFQVRILTTYHSQLRGVFTYPEPFDRV
jgi:putative acetyltransferase